MEGDREGVHSLSPKPRRQVLRPGVRIVAEHLAPYEDSPESLAIWEVGNFFHEAIEELSKATAVTARQFGRTIMAAYIDEMNRTTPPEIRTALPARLDFTLPSNKMRNDGKPKLVRQPEPSYVNLTKKKRR